MLVSAAQEWGVPAADITVMKGRFHATVAVQHPLVTEAAAGKTRSDDAPVRPGDFRGVIGGEVDAP
jgi:hypothetical protein